MKKHLFLTGEKQVGKSTLLQKILKAKKIDPCGFVTLPFFIEGEKRGYYLHALSPLEKGEYNSNVPAILRLGEKRLIGIEEVFESLGVHILTQALKENRPLVIDELGRAEKHCPCFINAVLRSLDEKNQIFGVVQKGAEHYLQVLKNHSRVQLVEVTSQNREGLFDQVIKMGL